MALDSLWAQDDSSFALRNFTHDERRIRYLDQGTGRVLFLVHGMTTDHRDCLAPVDVDGGGLADPALEQLGLEKGIYDPGSSTESCWGS